MTLISEWMDLCTGGSDVGFSSQPLRVEANYQLKEDQDSHCSPIQQAKLPRNILLRPDDDLVSALEYFKYIGNIFSVDFSLDKAVNTHNSN